MLAADGDPTQSKGGGMISDGKSPRIDIFLPRVMQA